MVRTIYTGFLHREAIQNLSAEAAWIASSQELLAITV
jgi:hypothetical protein